ncbi:major facilitator superfamily transporter [Colletotrichum graminicola]|uniref:Major facilitator superfamily transporter n=1 Tax=Colletotrichum graminicola (strain M1.001 / M2 / FGSC 10212) TaxID=645133 RepID=E3QHM4_COLGM|nr:major facilitator superfamily transporter [Colletotrichum graminicola M1.001]EFQ30362.1 major facilitator superfamily transporter [Colletotrichum graminicola M1.001]WDK18611.1 major facilitator superfamily transporter [Colletotrichum graminicola]
MTSPLSGKDDIEKAHQFSVTKKALAVPAEHQSVSSQNQLKTPSVWTSQTSLVSEKTDSEDEGTSTLVTWDGPEDPKNPKNWTRSQKWTTSLIISSFAFLSPLSSSIAAPALKPIAEDLHITNEVYRQLVLSVFLLTYALGPFILSPCSEIWGRTPIVRVGNMIFIISTTLCGFATSKEQILAFRFLAGIGGSVTVGMGSGILADCWRPEERGKGIAFMQFAPVIGLAIGPILGGYISQYATWRWAFWLVVIVNLTVQLIALFLLRETYAPRLLQLKARDLRKAHPGQTFHTEWEKKNRTLPGILKISLSRPWVMLATQPIIQSLAIYQAFNFGFLYLIISGFPTLWEDHYGMSKGIASLNYISVAVGSMIGVLICGPAMDATYHRLKLRYGMKEDEVGAPEFRIPLMIPTAFISPCGILLFAWSAQNRMHFLVPNIGIAITVGSSMISYQCISAYIADCFSLHTASASAACSFLRSMAAFSFPLFVPALFGNLGYGWGGSLLAIVAVVVGVPAPFLLWKFGHKLRTKSRFGNSR